jgi:hypothetical protein
MLDHGLVGEVLVSVDHDLADRNPLAFLDIEDHPGAPGSGRELEDVYLGGVVTLVLVERVDRGAGLLHRVAVEWAAFIQSDPSFDFPFTEPLHAAHRPSLQHRTLLDPDDQHQPLTQVTLLDHHVVKLAGAEERGDRPLDVPVIDQLVNDDAGAAEDLRGGETLVALDDDTVD